MRIIAGKLKGRRLSSPRDNSIRPTTDKVKEAIFNMLQLYTEDAVVIDLFSGTGNLGLEAISRGAARCYFCDRSRESISMRDPVATLTNLLSLSSAFEYRFNGLASDVIPHLLTDPSGFTSL